MKPYDHKKIEKKWQKEWDKKKIYQAKDSSSKPKFYGLIEFPFPSGDGMHTGHLRSNTAMDIISRKRRMEGYNVLYPIGWDAFGLPTENYAIKTGVHPKIVTKKNTDTFRRQLKSAGFSFDWSREINTTDPEYYKWTQWIFLKMYEKGLAYKKKMEINWCPKDKIGLANEEVIDGKCERCGTPVEKREKEQWMLAITKYADRLDKDLDTVDYLEKIKIQQRNWIGKSQGAEIEFTIKQENPPTFYQFTGSGKIKENEPYVERDAIMALVKHWSEDKYLGLKWKKVDWETLITGGVEQGQTPEEAARTEIEQETGYKNIKLKHYFGSADSRFYHGPKKQNRFGHFHMFVFELKDGERNSLSNEEQANHEPVWLTAEELSSFKLPSSHKYLIDLYRNGGKPKDFKVTVFTTRPDTIFGTTYLVLAPEHPLVAHFIHQSSNAVEIDEYIQTSKKKDDMERTAENKVKTGVEIKGIKAINPATGQEIPVFVADYVLAQYGTGAIMAVPAHDERDFEFAQKYNLPITEVVIPEIIDKRNPPVPGKKKVERKNVHVMVKDPKTGKYLCLKWKKHDWITFPMGGVEEGENIVDAARREVLEETGYKNLKNPRVIRGQVRAEYFATHKDQNRIALTQCVLFDLENEERQPIIKEESDEHDTFWADLKQISVSDYMTHSEMNCWLERMNNPDAPYVRNGVLINSGEYTGMQSSEALIKIAERFGKLTTTYKLRDWVFSRQRYWGEPIPMVFCAACEKEKGNGWVPVPQKDLPVKLPDVKNYQPTDTGESPLATITKWVNTKCPVCKGPATRETDTMPNWAGSSWYFLRYVDPKNKKAFADPKKLKYWTPVDWYNGGMEHTTLHLLYSRFWHKFLFDQGLVPTPEPYQKRTSHGLILAEGGVKMSKSLGNVVNPDSIIEEHGADTLRLYEMFMGPFDQPVAWSTDGIVGPRRFLERIWRLQEKVSGKKQGMARELSLSKRSELSLATSPSNLESHVHKTIKKVTEDIEAMQFNTAVSSLMILSNELEKVEEIPREMYENFLKLLAPFAPHLTEELWATLGHKTSIHLDPWPLFDASKIVEGAKNIVVQINGKVRAEFEISAEATEAAITKQAQELPEVKKWIEGKRIQKVIYVKGKLLNIVVG
jgi:leucyl-tRNA synthetase